jgi:hypothetical protein
MDIIKITSNSKELKIEINSTDKIYLDIVNLLKEEDKIALLKLHTALNILFKK